MNGPENEPLGVVPIQEALRMAGELDVDLVEIVATATPPPQPWVQVAVNAVVR